MPQDLPGFYYDAEKNRYFPLNGPTPGSSRVPSSVAAKKLVPKPTQEINSCRRSAVGTMKLLQARELYGKVIASSRGKYNFNEEFQKIQATQPVVWKYQGMNKIGDGALEQIFADVHTLEGQIEASVLLSGGINGSLSFFGVGKDFQGFDYGVKCIPDQVWPTTGEKQAQCRKIPGDIWSPPGSSLQLSSNISSIKLFRKLCAVDDVSHTQYALISTLGSETSGGSLYVVNLVEPFPLRRQRVHEVASLNCTIWTADCNSNGRSAVVGTNSGAASVDLETGTTSWLLRCRSDVLAQQHVQLGNVVLCGLRNGLIVTVDVRERQNVHSRLSRHRIPYASDNRKVGTSSKEWFKVTGNIYPLCTVKMPSSISSMVSLQFNEQYFLASSMDGSVRLYDQRMMQRGAVQCYEGHVNSHTRIQLGVDPTEKFVVSGGEDCNFRLWSIKSGELLFKDKFSNSVPTTVCWQKPGRLMKRLQNREDYGREKENSWGAWLGSQEGLYYANWPMT